MTFHTAITRKSTPKACLHCHGYYLQTNLSEDCHPLSGCGKRGLSVSGRGLGTRHDVKTPPNHMEHITPSFPASRPVSSWSCTDFLPCLCDKQEHFFQWHFQTHHQTHRGPPLPHHDKQGKTFTTIHREHHAIGKQTDVLTTSENKTPSDSFSVGQQ